MSSPYCFLALWSMALPWAATCEARLELAQSGSQLTVVGHCRNPGPAAAQLRYELLTEKRGRSGSSRNAQSGWVEARPGQELVLSRTTISAGPHDYYRVRLRLLDEEGNVLAADSAVHEPQR
ncbi:curli-like amyloid fiber formation chaperone CsgH [Hymenobacter sp. B81]|uniref:curli-like amyloid fiber formation chaperone CsgH n=1 Tax=Hymenobacter sp. B81 TaxID=3344878 RepID=UPI0037DDA04F